MSERRYSEPPQVATTEIADEGGPEAAQTTWAPEIFSNPPVLESNDADDADRPPRGGAVVSEGWLPVSEEGADGRVEATADQEPAARPATPSHVRTTNVRPRETRNPRQPTTRSLSTTRRPLTGFPLPPLLRCRQPRRHSEATNRRPPTGVRPSRGYAGASRPRPTSRAR